MNETWQIFLVLIAVVAGWSTIIIAALKVMFNRSLKSIEDKVAQFSATTRACADLERELLELKAAMPLEYLRREDFIRFELGINYKLDKLRDLFVDTFKRNNGE